MKTTISILMLISSSIFAQQTDSTQSGVIDAVVIQENYEAKFSEEKIPVDLELDFSDVVTLEAHVNWNSVDQFYQSKGKNVFKADINTLSPEFTKIQVAPVRTFKSDFKHIQRWHLDIISGDGAIFRSIAGVGNPPKEIAWDGLSNSGEALSAGSNYAYSFTAVDKAGNKRTFAGETFTIDAFYLYKDDGLLISVANTKLFAMDGLYLQPQAREFAQEIADFIRLTNKSDKIRVASNHPKAEDFMNLISEELIVGNDLFQISRHHKRETHCTNFILR